MPRTIDERIKTQEELIKHGQDKLKKLQSEKGKSILNLADKFIDIYNLPKEVLIGAFIKLQSMVKNEQTELKKIR